MMRTVVRTMMAAVVLLLMSSVAEAGKISRDKLIQAAVDSNLVRPSDFQEIVLKGGRPAIKAKTEVLYLVLAGRADDVSEILAVGNSQHAFPMTTLLTALAKAGAEWDNASAWMMPTLGKAYSGDPTKFTTTANGRSIDVSAPMPGIVSFHLKRD